MKIQTKFLGEVVISEETILSFPEGLLGFTEEKEFVLIPLHETSPFLSLQSVHSPHVGFMVASPYTFYKEYVFDVEQSDVVQLQIEKPEDVIVYGIITLKETIEHSTINLLAPIVVNGTRKMAKQIVLQNQEDNALRYPLKAPEGSVL